MLKTQEEHRYKFHSQFATHQEILPKFDSMYKSSVLDKKWGNGISAMPRSILRLSIWKLNLVFGPHVQKNWKPAFYFYFLKTSFGRLCFFGSLEPILSGCKKSVFWKYKIKIGLWLVGVSARQAWWFWYFGNSVFSQEVLGDFLFDTGILVVCFIRSSCGVPHRVSQTSSHSTGTSSISPETHTRTHGQARTVACRGRCPTRRRTNR